MTENGEILLTTASSIFRQRMFLAFPSRPTDPLTYRVTRTYSTRGIVGWAIRRHTREQFVMAKMAGFDIYNISDDFVY
jgi:hypothetical protein